MKYNKFSRKYRKTYRKQGDKRRSKKHGGYKTRKIQGGEKDPLETRLEILKKNVPTYLLDSISLKFPVDTIIIDPVKSDAHYFFYALHFLSPFVSHAPELESPELSRIGIDLRQMGIRLIERIQSYVGQRTIYGVKPIDTQIRDIIYPENVAKIMAAYCIAKKFGKKHSIPAWKTRFFGESKFYDFALKPENFEKVLSENPYPMYSKIQALTP